MVSKLNEWIVADYVALMKDNENVVLVGLDDLSVEEAQELRNRVRSSGAGFRTVKNRLAKVALHESEIPIEGDWFDGTCGLLVGDTESTIGAAKAMAAMWKKAEERKVRFCGAWLDGSALSPAEAAAIPTMPDKDTMRGMLLSALTAPMRGIAAAMNQIHASVARGLQARADQEG